ncbi:60S acidic ribosomal protein P1, putative [Eimeria acervulina]|uniref:60S acidic ribosomal protein P1, putative n=1 Tax=Eimeria acervulina TaxID=5801 RepID=U6GUC9_EIMAC|nr:60S acidic ribosomal protein P1, putative [Eimeria acervulina]CDI83871.1 60S acidic ribosomal protein P1, putative [Eimeria acervulina]
MAAVPTSSLSDNQRQELLCTYAALILSDEGMEISAENIQKLVSAAGASVEPYMPGLFARALKGHKVEDLITGAGSAAAAAPAAAAAAPAAAGGGAPAEKGGKAAKQEEPEEEEDADMGFSLFD